MEIQHLEECRLGVVPEAAPPEALIKTLIFLPKLVVSTHIWYQMKAYILHFIIV